VSSRTLGHIFLGGSLLIILTESSTCRSGQPSNVQVLVERVERVSSDEVGCRPLVRLALSFDSALQFLLFLLAKVFEEIFQGGTFLDDGIQFGNCRSQLAFFDSAVS
jgi:hypothetical protein